MTPEFEKYVKWLAERLLKVQAEFDAGDVSKASSIQAMEFEMMELLQPLKPDHTWVRTIFGKWIQLENSSVGHPAVDPSFERYWTM